MGSEPGKGGPVKAPMVNTLLAYVSKPLRPLMEKINVTRKSQRGAFAGDVMLPEGYEVEVVAVELNAPVHATFGPDGACYVTESGYKIDSPPRVVRIDVVTGATDTFFELPADRWRQHGAMTGGCWLDDTFYFANNDTISRVGPGGVVEDVVTGLPWGDHMPSYPIVGPDGSLYFTVGSVTNAGVVGGDNFTFEWLRHSPEFCDIPGQDITLAGHNYEFKDVVGSLKDTVRSGAYVPFGTETHAGQVIPGQLKASGSLLRLDPTTGGLEQIAWGLRNAYGIDFHPDGRLFVTNHGIDERGARFIVGAPDEFYEIQDGAWYGWPDYAAGVRLDDPRWGEDGRGREPVLAEPPAQPPLPFVTFEDHAASNGFVFCRDPAFGFPGDAFVCLFGDVAPVTTRRSTPVGYKVVRVDMQRREVVDFAVNRQSGPASQLPHNGFERPCNATFGPDGALYVVDWGEIRLAVERGGVEMPLGSGVLWRIWPTGAPHGERPPEAEVVPLTGWVGLPVVGEAIGLAKQASSAVKKALHRD